jgi:hypothetical protein
VENIINLYLFFIELDIYINQKRKDLYLMEMKILSLSLKAKSIKYNHIIEILDVYVNNNRNDLDKFKGTKGPSNLYDDNQYNY